MKGNGMSSSIKGVLCYFTIGLYNLIMGRLALFVMIILLFSFGDKSDRLWASLIGVGYAAALIGVNIVLYRLFKKYIPMRAYILIFIVAYFVFSSFCGLFIGSFRMFLQ